MDADLQRKLDIYLLKAVEDHLSYIDPQELVEKLADFFIDSFCDSVMESDAVGILAEQIARNVVSQKKVK